MKYPHFIVERKIPNGAILDWHLFPSSFLRFHGRRDWNLIQGPCIFDLGGSNLAVWPCRSHFASTTLPGSLRREENQVWIFWDKQENKPTPICKPKLFFFYFIAHKYFSTPAFSEIYFEETRRMNLLCIPKNQFLSDFRGTKPKGQNRR